MAVLDLNQKPLEIQIKQIEKWIENPPRDGMRITVVPKLANWILETKNLKNRPPKKKVFTLISLHGYRFIGGSIVFGTGGGLLDGQNRLIWCRETGTPIDTLFVFGVPDIDFSIIDSGAKRTAGDAF